MKTVIYTACFGDHDQPAELHGFEGQADLICFTDSPTLARERSTWSVMRRRSRFKTARMDAKWYKMSASHLFPEHELSIYIDSSVRFHKTEGFIEHCLRSLGSEQIAFYRHPEGQRSLAEEARFSLSMGKYIGEPLIEQAQHYTAAGFPGTELLAGGCIVRDHRPDPLYEYTVERFEKAWFDECVHWSAQDQISLPYVLWLNHVSYHLLPGSIYQNDYFSRIWSGPDR
ncbi:MAG TPA: glycosyltransferase domain-containing protein [Gemmatimonadaceae bacterium]|nr:glycosyltransferase domain-containing protein [Gemmatimonadaceae bacterium]